MGPKAERGLKTVTNQGVIIHIIYSNSKNYNFVFITPVHTKKKTHRALFLKLLSLQKFLSRIENKTLSPLYIPNSGQKR